MTFLLTRAFRVCRASVQTAGHLLCIAILASSQTAADLLRISTKILVQIISFLTGAKIEQDRQPMHKERFLSFQKPVDGAYGAVVQKPAVPHPLLAYIPNTGSNGNAGSEPFQVLDEKKTLEKVKNFYLSGKLQSDLETAATSVPDSSGVDQRGLLTGTLGCTETASPQNVYEANVNRNVQNPGLHFGDEEKLKQLAYRFISSEFGCLSPDLLADDFQFLFPVVGPLGKAEFVEAFGAFKVRRAFPNARSNFYNFHIDPLEPNRLWALSRGAYVQEGPLFFGVTFQPKPEGERVQINLPPQMFSWSFDGEGKVYKMTGGYCVDRTAGDTDGLGGMFGVLRGTGGLVARNLLTFPEGKPWNAWTRSCGWDAWSMRLPQILKDWRRALQ